MVGFYPLCAFGENRVAASIDTPLHAFLPFDHVDHLHPDWAIALAASANGERKLQEFNKRAGRKIIWVPWQRPGFELALMLQARGRRHPGCDGIDPRRPRALHVGRHAARVLPEQHPHDRPDGRVHPGARAPQRARPPFGGAGGHRRRFGSSNRSSPRSCRILRGVVSSNRRVIAHVDASDDALTFANSRVGGRPLPDGHELPRIISCARASRPMFIPWNPRRRRTSRQLSERIGERIAKYRTDYAAYYKRLRRAGVRRSCATANPSVVVVPGLGLFGFGKDKRESAHHDRVLRQRDPRDGGRERARRTASPIAVSCRRCAVRSRRATSSRSTTTSRCRDSRRSASSTGRSKKPSSSACRPRRSSAARSRGRRRRQRHRA